MAVEQPCGYTDRDVSGQSVDLEFDMWLIKSKSLVVVTLELYPVINYGIGVELVKVPLQSSLV